jgi:hypothetical protein
LQPRPALEYCPRLGIAEVIRRTEMNSLETKTPN